MPQEKKQQQNIGLSSDVKSRQSLCKTKISINWIENLSNEIFYEIFDYLDGYDIYQGFSNLNIRFENLIISSSLLLKIQFSSQSNSPIESRSKQFIDSNRHRIISFRFNDQLVLEKFLRLYPIDLSFNHVESIHVKETSTFKFVVLLFYLRSFPRLFSLTAFFDRCDNDLGDIYQMVFRLPFLKYFKFEISDYKSAGLTISRATSEQYTSIEYLSFYHYLTVNQLIDLLSYTPRLTNLYNYSIMESGEIFQSEILMRLTSLVHLNICIHHLTFDEFQSFIIKFSSQLRVLSVTVFYTDKNYLDADRWERFIILHIPYLTRFVLSYSENIDKNFKITRYYALINGFISPFWIKKQWIFRILIESDNINFYIRPYSEELYDFQEHIRFNKNFDENSSIHYLSGVNISLSKIVPLKNNQKFVNKIVPLFKLINVTRLVMEWCPMSIDTFIKIMNFLPNLDMIRITFLSPPEQFCPFVKNSKILRRFLDNNKISKVTIINIFKLEYIYFIIDLFPRMEQFAIQTISDVDLKLVVEWTLRKFKESKIRHSMTLCVTVGEGTNDKVDKLHEMIHSEKLLKDYTIDRRLNKFYLQWKC